MDFTLLRTQYGLTQSEMVKGMANRFMYSKFYIGLYLGLAILSFITIVMVIILKRKKVVVYLY